MSYFDHFHKRKTATPIGRILWEYRKRREAEIIQKYLPTSDMAILEIGPGRGEFAQNLLNFGYHNYTVVEPNATMREQLITKGLKVNKYAIPNLLEEDGTYDAVILISVFEHLKNTEEATVFFDEANRVLRERGILFILSPDYAHWKDDFFLCDYTHCNLTSVRRTIQLCQNHSFLFTNCIYFSAFFTGKVATFLSHIVRFSFFFVSRDGLSNRLYEFKLGFLRRFLSICVKK